MKALFLALTVQFFMSFTSSQAFEITRLSHGRDGFNIPASMCGPNVTDSGLGCKSFYAVDGARSCSCFCPARNATFSFYNREWSCVENRALRGHLYQGCDFTTAFTTEAADRRLPSLAFGTRRQINLSFLFWIYWRCRLDIDNSWFMGCWGSKQFLRHYNTSGQLFTITRSRSSAPYFLRVNNNVPNTDTFRGKIVNLILDCHASEMGFNFHTRNCLLFKLEGSTTCPVTKPTVTVSSTIHPMQTSSVVLSTSRITASQVFTNTTVFLGSTSVPSITITSHNLSIPSTISDAALTASYTYTTASDVSTYLVTQPNFTEIPTTTFATQTTVTEILPTVSTYQPTISGATPTVSYSHATVSKVSTNLMNQPKITEIPTKASASQSTVIEISPSASTSLPTISDAAPTASNFRKTVSEVSTYLGNQPSITEISTEILASVSTSQPAISKVSTNLEIQSTFSKILPRALVTQPPGSGISAKAPVTQKTMPGILPTASDALPPVSEIPPTNPEQPTASEILPTEPNTQPAVTETSRKLSRDPDTSQKPSILPPERPEIEPTTLQSKVPPTLSPDRERKTDKGSSASWGLIAGLPVAVIIIAAIVVCFIYRRRHANKRPRSYSGALSEMTMDTIVTSPQTNRAFQTDDGYYTYNSLDYKDPPPLSASTFPFPGYDVPHSIIRNSLDRDLEDKTSHVNASSDTPSLPPVNNQVTNMESTTSHVTEEKKRPTNDNNNNKNKDPMYYVLEGPYPQSIEETADPSNDKPLEDPEEPIYCSLDEVIPVASETPSSDSDDEYEYNVLEREDYRGSKAPLHYVQMSSDGSILKSSEIPHSDNSKNHPNDIEGNDEPIYSILERRYFGGSKVPSHYVEVLPNGSGFNILDKLKQDTFKGSKNDNKDSGKRSSNGPECANEPASSILEGRYLEGPDVPGYCLQISPKEPVYSILDRLYRQSIKESPYYPKRGSGPLDNTLQERFLGGSKDPEHEERMAPNEPVYSILEKLYRQSIKASSYDPKHGKEPEKNSLEVRYLERSEVPENYVQVSGPVFSILEKLYRQSIKGSTYSPNRGKEPVDKTLEERHLEGSEDPKKDERVDPNEPVYSILERLYRQSVKESSGDPKCANNQADNTLEERYLERSEVPENYVQMSGPVFSILEKLYRQSVKGSSYAIKCANEPDDKTSLGRYYESSNVPKHYAMPRNSSRETTCGTKAASEPGDRILEECYLEGSEVPENYVQISPNGPVFSILERLYRKSIRGSSYLPQSAKDPDEKPLEGCYFEGSEVPEHYVWISRRRSASKARNSTKFKEANHDLKAEDEEQVETLLEERYFEGSEVPNHYVRISRDGSVFSIIERSKGNSVKGSNHDSDSADEEVESILEGRYFEGSEVPERYERICRKGSVFSILDKPNQKSVKFSDDDSKPTDEQVDMCLEGRYFEGSEIPERYVRISRKGSIFSILDKSNRKSIKDFDDDPKPEDEKVDSILEGRYFEGSEVPDHYVRISRKGSVFSIIESDRKSVKGSNHDPKETDEQGGSTLEGRYFRASKVPRRYVRFSRKETVFSIADESVKGPSDDPNPADEPANLEGRYFEGSEPEVPENYATNVPVYSILERLYRQSTKGSRCDPKRANEPDEKILEGGYFEESEVAEHYVLMPTLNALEKLFRKSIKGFIRDPDEKHGHHDQPEEKGLKGSNVEGSSSKETDR